MSEREDLIGTLAADLQPVKPSHSIDLMALIWLGVSATYVVLVTHLFGPIRPGALQQLVSEPRFLIETASGVAAISVLALCAFRAAIPGRLTRRFGFLGLALLLIWLLQYVFGLVDPTLAPSMEGKREGCFLQTMCYSVPPMLVAFFLTRRLYPLKPLHTALFMSLVAGLLPALYMQLACMYIVPHILQFHILPGLLVAVVGSGLAVFYRR